MSLVPAAVPAIHFDSLEQEVFLNLWRTYDRLREVEAEFFGRYGLSAQQYNVLRLLKAADPHKVPTLELAERLVSRAPDITRILDKLQDRRLITRLRSQDDRRTVLVGITSLGRALLGRMSGPLAECHARQLGHLTSEQLNRLAELLRAARAPHEQDGGPWPRD